MTRGKLNMDPITEDAPQRHGKTRKGNALGRLGSL
jgi:hypothetical protein